ncbi:MAG: peptidyl-prolyl cis-trans isomerase [Velocimicrobium sp.]
MNSGKKSISGKKKTNKKVDSVPTGNMAKKVAVGVMLAALAVMLGVVAWEGLAPKYLLSVNGEKLKENDLMYDIYKAEQVGAQMAGLYAQFGYTEDYWSMDNGDGTTTQSSLKDQTVENYMYNRVIYTAAVEAGYEATDDEKKEAADAAKADIESLTEKKASSLGLTQEVLTQREMEDSVVGRYKQDTIDGLNLDEDQIKAGVDYDTYRGYSVEYFYAPTTTTDDDGKSVAVDDKTKIYGDLEAVLKKANESGDWSKIIDAEDKDATVSYKTSVLTPKDDTFSEDIMGMITQMDNKEISAVVEADDGYYVFHMIDNNDPEKYDTAVKDAISKAQEDAFNNVYEDLYSDYEVKVFDENWSDIIFGTITLS